MGVLYYSGMDPKVIEKFLASVEKTNFCWNWKGFLSKRGTPIIRMGAGTDELGKKKLIEYSPRQVALYLQGIEQSIFSKPTCGNKLCVNPAHLMTDNVSRFWAKVHKLNEIDGCWIWLAGEDKNGYGKFTVVNDGKQSTIRAHQYSWWLYTGRQVPSNLFLCHSCDNPRCVNPMHLWLGTNQDNTADRHAKGRSAMGESHGCHKLTETQVLEIRHLRSEGASYLALAQQYSISKGAIHGIVSGRNWKHLL